MASTTTPPLIIRYNRFLLNGKPFLFRGVVYQLPRGKKTSSNESQVRPRERYADRDPLKDTRLEDLRRDVEIFKELGINALWIYIVCIDASHDASMRLLQENGIYVFIGCWALGPGECINRMAPREAYGRPLLERFYAVVDAFSEYDNVAGFNVADQLVNSPATTEVAEVVKAVVREVKRYIALKAQDQEGRRVPVGVADATWTSTQTPSLEYYTAGSRDEQVDFYALVKYDSDADLSQWQAGWDGLTQRFAASKVPVVLSEYGNNITRPRHFPDTGALYSEAVRKVFSGGFAYEFFEAANRYGLVKDEEGTLKRLEDFHELRLRFEEARGADKGLQTPSTDDEGDTEGPYPPTSDTWRASANIPKECPWSAAEHLRSLADDS